MSDARADHLAAQADIHREIAHLYSIERVNATIFNRAFNDYWNRLVLSMMPPDRDARVIDLMGGTGLLSQALVGGGYRNVVLLDLSVDMLAFAGKSLGPALRLCSADAMRLPMADETFDVAICRGGLHHLPDMSEMIREVRRILKKGGTFLTYDPCDDLPPVRWLRRAMYRVFRFFDHEHERGLSSPELAAAFVAGGMTVKEMRKFGFLGYAVSGIEAHLFPRVFATLPRIRTMGDALCRLDRRLEGRRFLLATAVRAVKE